MAQSGRHDRADPCPLLAQSGHLAAEFQCPLLGAKRTWRGPNAMSAFDPKRTSAASAWCVTKVTALIRKSHIFYAPEVASAGEAHGAAAIH